MDRGGEEPHLVPALAAVHGIALKCVIGQALGVTARRALAALGNRISLRY